MLAICRFVAAARFTYEQFQVTLSHEYLNTAPLGWFQLCSGAKINCTNIFIYLFIYSIALPSQSPTTCTAEQHLTNQIQDLGSGSLGRSKPAPNHRPTLKVSASVPQPQKGNTPNYMEMDGLTFSEDDDDEDEYDDYDKIDDLLKTKSNSFDSLHITRIYIFFKHFLIWF